MSPIPSVRLTSIPTAVPVGRVHDKTLQEIAAWQPLELPELGDEMRRVRGDGRRHLFHDSWTGITAWVDEHELKDGAFQISVFEWGKSTHCDTLIVGSPVAHGAANV